MNLLLDTHVWVWAINQSVRLPASVRRKLDDGNNSRWLSPISIWEAGLLMERGRVELFRDAASLLRRALDETGVREAPLTHDVALESRRLLRLHEDPADRLLVATARVMDLVLVTADRKILESRACRTLAA